MKALLDQLRIWAEQQPQQEAIVLQGCVITYAELLWRIDAVADELTTLGCQRLALHGGNDLDWLLVDLAAASLAIPVVPIPLFFSAQQRRHLLLNSAVDTIYCGQQTADLEGERRASELLPGNYRKLTGSEGISATVTAPSKITYTSGSTGTPKGACLTGDTLMTIVTSLAGALAPSGLQRHLCLLPFATLLENVAGAYLTLWMGRSLVIEDTTRLGLLSNNEFDAEALCKAISRYNIESIILLPQMLKCLLEHGDIDALKSLKFIAVGGGKVASDCLNQAHALGLPVFEGYGLTECGSCVALNTPSHAKVGSVGQPLAHAKVRISESGEVIVTGAAMMGYLGDTTQAIETEIATGDAGYIDDDGFLYITGRIKNTIISGFGRNISPEWVESVFLGEPAIQQMAVFGEGAPFLSAVLVTAPDYPSDCLSTLIARVNSSLPDYARIKAWHRIYPGFSTKDGTLTANGKLCRSRIAERYGQVLAAAPEVAA